MRAQNLALFLIGGLVLNSAAWAVPIQWSVGDGGNDHWYEAVQVTSGIGWEGAKTAAIGAGGHLATITSASENNFVFDLVDDFSTYWFTSNLSASLGPWIGGFQPIGSAEPGAGWSWVTGEAFSYENWAPGEPNNNPSSGPSEDSIHYFFQGIGTTANTWNDIDGDGNFPLQAYVIEYNSLPIPEPTTLALMALGLAGLGYSRRKSA